ncbi:MAG: hypothetical protein V5A44_06640 [Haloarculaceae archaeon]
MATSTRQDSRQVERADEGLSRYDLVLLVIPATFLLALVASQVSSFGLSASMGLASVVGAVAVADGLFLNPPARSDR